MGRRRGCHPTAGDPESHWPHQGGVWRRAQTARKSHPSRSGSELEGHSRKNAALRPAARMSYSGSLFQFPLKRDPRDLGGTPLQRGSVGPCKAAAAASAGVCGPTVFPLHAGEHRTSGWPRSGFCGTHSGCKEPCCQVTPALGSPRWGRTRPRCEVPACSGQPTLETHRAAV